MTRFSKFVLLLMILVLLTAIGGAVVAQGPGEGGTIVESNIGGDDAKTFNPIIVSDTTSDLVASWLYPDIIELDPVTLQEIPGIANGMAESWEYDETGTVLTINLRQDMFWSDGEQINADDYLWAFEAVRSGETSSSRTYVFDTLADGTSGGGPVIDYQKVDDFTLEFTLGEAVRDEEGNITEILPNCIAITDLNDIPVVPSHAFEAAFGDDYASMDDDPYFLPESGASFGEFFDPFFEAGVQVSLIANQSYGDAINGEVIPGEWIYLNVPDQTVEYERFLAGEITFTGISAANQNELRGMIESGEADFQIREYPANGYSYIAWNVADPANPQSFADEEGNMLDQGLHPIFGDVRVRVALAHAIDVDSMIGTRPDLETDAPATGILEGNGTRVTTHTHLGVKSVDPGIEPYAFDPEMAVTLLAEAGWSDGDGDGILECNGCLYATEVDASFEGSPFEFSLQTNSGNEIRERIGETVKSQLANIGVTVNFQAIDFGTLVDELLGQAYDAIIIGWNLGLPFDPDARWAFGSDADRVGSGFNTTSYYNAELEDLWEQAVTFPNCEQEGRNELYVEAMKILHEEQPYMFLFAGNVMSAAQPGVANFDPLPYANRWNIETWSAND